MSRDIRYPAPEPEDTPLSVTLRRRRVELGLTLRQIADRMDATEATVQRWESGVIKSVRYHRLVKLAGVLQAAPAELVPPEARKTNPPADRAADGFEERTARLIQLALRLLPEQKAFLLSVLEEAVRRLPREALSREPCSPDVRRKQRQQFQQIGIVIHERNLLSALARARIARSRIIAQFGILR